MEGSKITSGQGADWGNRTRQKHTAEPHYRGQKIWHRMEEKEDLWTGEWGWRQLDTGEGHWDDQAGEEGGRLEEHIRRNKNLKPIMEQIRLKHTNKIYQLPVNTMILALNCLLLTVLAEALFWTFIHSPEFPSFVSCRQVTPSWSTVANASQCSTLLFITSHLVSSAERTHFQRRTKHPSLTYFYPSKRKCKQAVRWFDARLKD